MTNGSGCGCDLASERPMVRKFIVDSVLYWAKTYHIDGFRFDLMALEDVDTMTRSAPRSTACPAAKASCCTASHGWAAVRIWRAAHALPTSARSMC